MFIIEESNTILVHDRKGRLVYKSLSIVQYKKFNAGNLVVITEETIDFVSEVKTKDGYDITVVSDENFKSAMIHDELIFIERKLLFPIMDVLDANLMNVLRLYQNISGDWIYFVTKLGLPVRKISPKYLDTKILYGTSRGKDCAFNLESRQIKTSKATEAKGIALEETISKFKVGFVK